MPETDQTPIPDATTAAGREELADAARDREALDAEISSANGDVDRAAAYGVAILTELDNNVVPRWLALLSGLSQSTHDPLVKAAMRNRDGMLKVIKRSANEAIAAKARQDLASQIDLDDEPASP